VRIFCLAGELPFAGHPTLGSCRAWTAAGGIPQSPGRIIQQCGVGLVEVEISEELLSFRAPPLLRDGPLDSAELAEALRVSGADPEAVVEAVHVANGPNWQLLRLRSSDDVLAARPAERAAAGTDIAGPWGPGGEADWELRTFFVDARERIVEDPVTGSFNASVAQHLFASGLARGRYTAAQGRCTGTDGRIHCRQEADGSVWIGGRADMVAQGATLSALP